LEKTNNMRAKTVNENINFERGKKPKVSIGIGAARNAFEITGANIYATTTSTRGFKNVDEVPVSPELLLRFFKTKKFIQVNPSNSSNVNEWVIVKGINGKNYSLPFLLKQKQVTGIIYKGIFLPFKIGNFKNDKNYLKESLDFKRGRSVKSVLNVGLIAENRDPQQRTKNLQKAFPEIHHAYTSTQSMSAPGLNPVWQITNVVVNDDEETIEVRNQKYLKWLQMYTDFDIIEDNPAERSYHPFGDKTREEQHDQTYEFKIRNEEDVQ